MTAEKTMFYKDFQKVRDAVRHTDNKKYHYIGLKKLIKILDYKWCYNNGFYHIPSCEAVYPLYDEIKHLK